LDWDGREGVGREAGEESSGDPGVNERVASNCGVDGLDQLLGGGAFQEKTSGACFESPVNTLIGVERGDHHDGNRILIHQTKIRIWYTLGTQDVRKRPTAANARLDQMA
jgi:hypothetical protein